MIKALVNFICIFIPSKNLRMKIRNIILYKGYISEEKILEYFSDNYPNKEVKKLGSGVTSQAYLVGDVLFKFQRKKYDLSENIREKKNCDFVASYLYAEVPNITILPEVKGLSYKVLKGHVVKTLIDESDVVKDINLTLNSVATFLSQLHSISLKEAKRNMLRKNRILSLKFKGLFLGLFLAKRYFSFREVLKINFLILKSFFLKKDVSIIHNDFSFYNALLDDDGKVCGAIDWAGAAIEERYWDLASFKVRLSNDDSFNYFIDSYDKKFGKKTDMKKLNILALLKAMDLLHSAYSVGWKTTVSRYSLMIKSILKEV